MKLPATWKMMGAYLWRHRWWVLLGLLALLAVDAVQLLIPRVIRSAIDDLAAGHTIAHLWVYFLDILGIAGFIVLFRFSWRFYLFGTSRKIEEEMRNLLYQHFLSLPVKFYDTHKVGDLMAHSTNDIAAVREMAGVSLIALVDAFIWSAATILMMFLIQVRLTLILLIPLPALGILSFLLGRLIYQRFRKVQDIFSLLTSKAEEIISGIRIIKAYVQEEGECREFRKIHEQYRARQMDLIKISGAYGPAIAVISGLSTTLLLIFGGRMTLLNQVSLGDFVALNTYLGFLIWPMMATGWVVNLYQRGMASLTRILDLLSVTPEPYAFPSESPADALKPPPQIRQGILDIQHLTFSYDGRDEPVLHDITLSIQPGEPLGIVGRTGAGKSTLVALFTRLYTPPEQTLFIDHLDILRYPLHALRSAIACVPQESFLFSDSIKENIAFGNPDAPFSEIIRVSQLAEIHEEILTLPDGYSTLVGERGLTLSGGQRQRIALARALLMNPKLLILDDALSAVDSETESKILRNLQPIFQSVTAVVITHRISVLKDFPHIAVLEKGRLIEYGNHATLLQMGGIYARMYEFQALEEKLFRQTPRVEKLNSESQFPL